MTADTAQEIPRLTAELEAAALRAVRAWYDDLNSTLFEEKLRRPTLELSNTRDRLGQWRSDVRTLELSRVLLTEAEWGDVVEVLKHEMAHQYVQEVLGDVAETAHGATFQRVCAERGIDARAAGTPRTTAEASAAPLFKKISALLALAQSGNQHEAELAMNTAQRLMLKYNLEQVNGAEQRYCFRHVGKPTGRVNEAQRLLALVLSEHFFVDVIWVPVWRVAEGKRGSVIEVCGTRDNVELAEYVYWFLTHTAERLWREHKARGGITQNRDRQAYLGGVMAGFAEKLADQRLRSQVEGLVWSGDPELRRYLRQRHRYMRWTRYQSAPERGARADGRSAGRQIILHKGVKQGTAGGNAPKLLKRG